MDVQSVELTKQSPIIKAYKNREESIFNHFHYDPYQLSSFKRRYEYLIKQNYKREELVDVLLKQNARWFLNDQIRNNIEAIKNPESVVIIGGQQVGLLTGPLYTIHKIVSIIIQAKEQQDYLKKPVVPVFWMAGEDHDFEEINHIFAYHYEKFNKYKVNAVDPEKTPVSNREIDFESIKNWVDELFKTFQETNHTKDVYSLIISALENSKTYVDFFAILIQKFFSEEGLVLVDSNDEGLRELEKDYFKQLVQHQNQISESVVQQLDQLEQKGFSISLDATREDGHLFYHHQGERLLLEKNGDVWASKDEQVKFSEDELLKTIEENPRCFSNNVVTRPLMQEMVFPVLSFIGGPGEIAYWSVLKPAFHSLNLQLPIVTPRISMTLTNHQHVQWLNRYGITNEQLISKGLSQFKMNWLKRQTKAPIDDIFNQIKHEVTQIHEPLQEVACDIQDDLVGLTQSNLKKIHAELDFLDKRFQKEVKKKNQITIKRFDQLEAFYHPKRGLQERTWNLIYFLNIYGIELPTKLLSVPPRWEQDHLFVVL